MPLMRSMNKIILKNSPFMELSFIVRHSYTLYELQHCKKYNSIRKSIPYNEQYELHDFKKEVNKIELKKFPEWSLFIH